MARVKEIAAESIREWERISAHSHITGLGLDGLRAKPIADGMVGQIEAREAAGLVVRLIKQGKFGGRAVLLVGPPGTGKCVSGDTPVLLANGCVKEIKEIYEEWKDKGEVVEKNENEEIIRVEGLKVVSLNPFNLKVEIKPVEYIYKQKIEEKILEVKLRSGRKIKVTKSHPLLSIKNGKLLFVESCKLKVGDYVAIPRRVVVEIENDHLQDSTTKHLEFRREAAKEWSKFMSSFHFPQAIENFAVTPLHMEGLLAQPLMLAPRAMEFLGYSLSNEIIETSSWNLRFLDGSEEIHQKIEFTVSSEKMANELSYLLLRSGIVARIKEEKLNDRTYYKVLVFREDLMKSFEKRKRSDMDIFWDEIVDVREVEEKEVYDLCVKDNHTFIAGFGGIIVHNTALANAIAKELGKDVPFVQLAASEIFSTDIRKTEFLTQTLRKAIGARIHEIRKVYEGVVKELEVEKAPHPYNPYQQIPVGAKIKIATKNESKTLKVDQSFAIQIYQQGIETGDIVQIDPELGRIVKLGKSEEAVKEKGYDITREKALPIPSGDVLKEKEFVYPVTLHSLDVAFAREAGSDIFSLFFGGRETKEIEPEIRQQVDEYIKELVQQGKCELLPGVVFIDEVSMLDIETFAFLNRAMEQELCPILIFATNRGLTNVRGTDIVSPHGIPLDLLDRLLIINTKPYTKEEIRKILEIRAEKEKVKIEKEALDYLTQIGEKTSLRHAIQLLAPAYEVAKENKREKITVEDIKFVEERFVDVKKSVEYMKSLEEKFLK